MILSRTIRGVGPGLASPVGLSAPRHTRPVSYYALFQGWLLLSQPPGCLRTATTLPTQSGVGDLSRRSGLFPSRRRIFAPAVSRPAPAAAAFGVWFGSVSGKPPRRSSALPPRRPTPGLHLNAFRGEPAISGFAWHFTPTRSSSGLFATSPGAALHRRVPPASAWPRVDHPVSGRSPTTARPSRTRFRCGCACPWLHLAAGAHSSAHSTKGTPSPRAVAHPKAPTGRKRTVSGSLSLPSPGCFSPFPHGTGSLSVASGTLALGGGPPRFTPPLTWTALLTIPIHSRTAGCAYGPLTPCGTPFQRASATPRSSREAAAAPSDRLVQPPHDIAGRLCRRAGLGSSRFARRYYGTPLFSSGY
jgi:hypothetical protein